MIKQIKNIVFIDIETISITRTTSELSDRMKACWELKSNRIAPEQLPDEVFQYKAAIFAEFGKIITISVGYFYEQENQLQLKIKSLYSHNEKELLESFNTLISKFPEKEIRLCAHNGKEFDYPYLSRRMLINSIQLPSCLDTSGLKPWEIKHLDTLEMWKFGDKKNYTSLELLACVLDIPSSKNDIDGSQVGKVYYQENDLERIAKYCSEDVATTALVYLRMNQMALIPKENIIFIH